MTLSTKQISHSQVAQLCEFTVWGTGDRGPSMLLHSVRGWGLRGQMLRGRPPKAGRRTLRTREATGHRKAKIPVQGHTASRGPVACAFPALPQVRTWAPLPASESLVTVPPLPTTWGGVGGGMVSRGHQPIRAPLRAGPAPPRPLPEPPGPAPPCPLPEPPGPIPELFGETQATPSLAG